MSNGFDIAYTANRQICLPDIKIEKEDSSHIFVPLRGYSASLAVVDGKTDRFIGWIDTRTLGYENAKEWMLGTKWFDQGW